jgi:hypothetical protein
MTTVKTKTDFSKPTRLDDIEVAFGANALDYMPPRDEIPEEFKSSSNKWRKFQADWFFYGLLSHKDKVKKGIDATLAWQHLRMIQGSWDPKHEHKEEAVAYLASLWFDDIKYVKARRV